MPPTELVFYLDDDGTVPVVEYLEKLRQRNRRAFAKVVARLNLLAEMGSELRRPAADSLRDGIHELRARAGTVQPRVLYCFEGRNVVLLAHGLTKEDEIPARDIDRALDRKRLFEKDPDRHSFFIELDDLED
jgi:hypothetical protein